MKITAFVRDDGPCGYYRVTLPYSVWAMNDPFVIVDFAKQGIGINELASMLEDSDVVVVPRPGEPNFHILINEMKKEGKRIVVEFDDNLFDVSPFSNHYAHLGTKEVVVALKDGSKMKLWEDGKNIDIKKNVERMNYFKRTLEIADAVTVTTDILADIYREYNGNVYVLPNSIDVNMWKALPFQRTEEVRFGWFGGSSHYEDLMIIKEPVRLIMEAYENTRFVVFGQAFKGFIKDLPEDRVEIHPWVNIERYHYEAMMMNLDFAVIPLVDNDFNRCKSPIKWIEMSAMEVPCVMSLVSPYREVYTGENAIMIEDNDESAWFSGMSEMIESSILRKSIGAKARKDVEANFDINKNWRLWKFSLEEVLNGSTNTADV